MEVIFWGFCLLYTHRHAETANWLQSPAEADGNRRRYLRVLVALVLATGSVLAVSATTQQAAKAATCLTSIASVQAGIPAYEFAPGCGSTLIPGSHHCVTAATVNGTQAIECADIVVTSPGGTPEMWGEGEFYCQAATTQCAGMQVNVWAGFSQPGSIQQGTTEMGGP